MKSMRQDFNWLWGKDITHDPESYSTTQLGRSGTGGGV
jgi:hypothetical protein